jgi:acetyl-CoA carboxylase carboxyl transferase subunit alpha
MTQNNKQSVWEIVLLARDAKRPKAMDYIPLLIDGFMEMHGDRLYGDDHALVGGIGYFNGIAVTVLAQNKGKTLDENLACNFGMMHPEGYRKAMRLAKQAEKFNRPILTFIDTPGAYPGKGAEERGQASAIAESLKLFATIKVPVIAIVLSEGGSGGALALSVANSVIMLENAVYSILSPEGFASILYKDESRAKEVAEIMKMTAYDLKKIDFVDEIITEPKEGAQKDFTVVVKQLIEVIDKHLKVHLKKKADALIDQRIQKFRNIGVIQ